MNINDIITNALTNILNKGLPFMGGTIDLASCVISITFSFVAIAYVYSVWRLCRDTSGFSKKRLACLNERMDTKKWDFTTNWIGPVTTLLSVVAATQLSGAKAPGSGQFVYFMLKRFKSSGAAIAFVVYLVVGSWVTALARFDLVPAALTLGAVMLAERAKWKWAFVLLALATLLKFYALVLILPLFIAQQKQCSSARWFSWRRWDGFAWFIAVCVVVTTISLLLNVDGTLGSLAYFKDRPIQVEAFQAGLLWLGSFLGYSLQFVYSFGSGNVLSELSSPVSSGATLCFVAGLCYTYWLQWRGRLDVATASSVALLVATVTAKVFSPQYLIWVTPFVAYMGKSNWKWLVSWGGVAVLTSFIYPYIYTLASATPGVISVGQIPAFYPAVLLRGAIMLGIIFALLYQAVRIKASRQSSLVSPS